MLCVPNMCFGVRVLGLGNYPGNNNIAVSLACGSAVSKPGSFLGHSVLGILQCAMCRESNLLGCLCIDGRLRH